MQGRSWMAALTLAVSVGFSVSLVSASLADEKPVVAKTTKESQKAAASKPGTYSVKLELRVAGLGVEGCDVELKPAHRGCSFETVKKHIDRRGELLVVINDIKSTNADRDCTFAIVIKEPGHAPRTERRGLRLAARTSNAPQSLPCLLSSPSKIARSDETADTKR